MNKSILVAIGAALCLAGCGQTETTDMQSTTGAIENIMTRVSVRKFKPAKLSDSQIETLLRAGMAAPSAVNKQPWEFVVVDDRALLDSLQAAAQNIRISNGCQQVIVVCGNEQKALEGEGRAYWIQDCSAATQNILLAAHATGLGAVWCGIAPIKERMAKVGDILSLPSYVKPLCVICVGEPDETPEVKDKWKPENVHHNAQW
ncbi:nitroreductase family protein [Salmonella enterica]|nr:nitroreductase family protein [Salmonella enterica]